MIFRPQGVVPHAVAGRELLLTEEGISAQTFPAVL